MNVLGGVPDDVLLRDPPRKNHTTHFRPGAGREKQRLNSPQGIGHCTYGIWPAAGRRAGGINLANHTGELFHSLSSQAVLHADFLEFLLNSGSDGNYLQLQI
jgi:hypothetical protein